MKLFLLLVLIVALALAACVSRNPVPPPAFVSWCDVCERYTAWGVGYDYFYCSQSGTVWIPAQEVKP
ncbi:MAG: hypothetical protein FWC64_07075 [Treponema sp.]|nr:hypothetical protein [Treponema sp.]